ncbi:tyrosine-protein phosphatase [Streptomyces litchfieldiae]|uniref:Tyrosine-protein phosphatase n=1 Tax=Streptomyces litchfieldiae TaxID=3075543 RepID=A0ABU2MRR2_9ACTN|nr:tyrosine-protein phosphatase [Streptomyces sp. DSM 44938]MDT0344315.1 tyrosine-protein phosphatase [Streptomyces sp. DSM 44938]
MTQQRTDESALTGVRNFRDVGGLPTTDGAWVRHGVLYRSGHLAYATPADRAFLSGLGLRTVFDFRNSADQALEGQDVPLPGVRNVNLPLNEPTDGAEFWALVRDGSFAALRAELTDGQGVAMMIDSYREMILTRTAEHGQVLRTLAAGDVPALLHCSAGKDRAGLTVALTLLAVGVARDTILTDYLESNAPHRRYLVRRGEAAEGAGAALPEEVAELLAPLFDARAEYLLAAFELMDSRWGGTETYLTEGLGLTPEDRERLRGLLVTAG